VQFAEQSCYVERMANRLFPALLRYWRQRRGLSQLELALQADVSSRHVSFLESGRSVPSEAMVLRLFAVLGVPLRDQNQALLAAGMLARFPENTPDGIPPEVKQAIAQMIEQHEPFPLVVLSADSVVLCCSRGATALFKAFVAEPAALPMPLDMITLLFDERLLRPFVVGWESLARAMVSRLHRELLLSGDPRLAALLQRIFSIPGVPVAWRHPDFATETEASLTVRLERDSLRAAFLVTVTVFSIPRQVALDELRIESCFPLDAETRALCARLADG
jgi:transcriptional regulator with XRE-family HTH domain